MPYHHGVASSQVSDGRKSFQVWRVAWNILGTSKNREVWRRASNPSLYGLNITGILDGFFGTIY